MKNFNYLFFLLLLLLFTSCGNNTKDKTGGSKKSEPAIASVKEKKKDKESSFKGLNYSTLKKRKATTLKNDSVRKIISEWLSENKNPDIETLTDFILQTTAEHLNFSFDKCSSNPENLVLLKKANCVGYAAYFAALMNFALNESGLNKQYTCKHLVAKIYFEETNLNALINDPFFKDHDFNVIEHLQTKEKIAVDPSFYDYMGVKRVNLKEK